MGEKYQYSKEYERNEADDELYEYLNSPENMQGEKLAIVANYEEELTPAPLTSEILRDEARNFVINNLKTFLPAIIQDYDYDESASFFGITNEDLGLLGTDYAITKEYGSSQITKGDSSFQYGSENGVSIAELIALLYMKQNVALVTRRSLGLVGRGSPSRYYLKNLDRYLYANDFGMMPHDDYSDEVRDGDVSYIMPFIDALSEEISQITENLKGARQVLFDRKLANLKQENRNQPPEEYVRIRLGEGGYRYKLQELAHLHAEGRTTDVEQFWIDCKRYLEDDGYSDIGDSVSLELSSALRNNQADRETILDSVPLAKMSRELEFSYDEIAVSLGMLTNDPIADYDNFDNNSDKISSLVVSSENSGGSIPTVYLKFYNQPVIASEDSAEIISYLDDVTSSIKGYLAERAINREAEELRDCVNKHRTQYQRWQKGNYYDVSEIYDFIRKVGPEKADEVLAIPGHNVCQLLESAQYLNAINFDYDQASSKDVIDQIDQSREMIQSGLWGYLKKRSFPDIGYQKGESKEFDKGANWLKYLEPQEGGKLFSEGKAMYRFAKQICQAQSRYDSVDFLQVNNYYYSNWEPYDLASFSTDEDAFIKHIDKNLDLITALMKVDEAPTENSSQGDSINKGLLSLIIKALESGRDMQGLALANDKQRYLKAVISGESESGIDFAISDWPEEWKAAVSREELELYYEHANGYLIRDQKSMTRYAAWRSSEEGNGWDDIFDKESKTKASLDMKMCMAMQTPEVRGWYRSGAEYVGAATMQKYLLRFNVTHSDDGGFADWHDALYWVPNFTRIESGEAKAILSGIETADDNQAFNNFLQRYNREKDLLVVDGPIQTLSELIKRVLAIESHIDLSKFPPKVSRIISAPKFDLASLDTMVGEQRFTELVEGKLDEAQPFQPYQRMFAGRPLVEALKEGLGSFRQKIIGTAADPKEMFRQLNQLVTGREINGKKMQLNDLLVSVPLDLEEPIIRILQEQKVDIGPSVTAQVHAKSDPEGWVCGNYTNCCMPFGNYRNDDYMFNPATQYFTIKYNGRIVAQSVVTDATDRRDNSDVVVLDNIEVADNYTKLTPLLANVYQTFWAEYTSKPVKIGTGYSDLIPPIAKLEDNKYRPKKHLQYSDATGSVIYDLPKIRGVESLDKVMAIANITAADSELIAKMEADSYPEGMAQGKSYISEVLKKQRELEVPGAASSFMIRQGKEPAGYLLVLPEDSEVNRGEKAAHIYDMAVLPKFRGSTLARKMMERVLESATAYGVSIEAEARASTSYALLMNERIRRWFETKGFYLTHNEKLPEYLNGEDFYFVRFENRNIVEAVETVW